VDWNDLQRLIEGEAIILFGGRRIYAKLFHAAIDISGPMRLNRPLRLPAPKPETITGLHRFRTLHTALAHGAVDLAEPGEVSPTWSAMIAGMADAVRAGRSGEACLEAALAAAGAAPFGEADETPPVEGYDQVNTEFTEMLDDALDQHPSGSRETPRNPIDA